MMNIAVLTGGQAIMKDLGLELEKLSVKDLDLEGDFNLSGEKMAVVIQQVVGQRHDQYLYPDVAGVARSHNFYPMGAMKASDGVTRTCRAG